jgi:hypothetical protein
MKALLKWAPFVAALLLLLLLVSAAPAKAPSQEVKHASRHIVAIAMDGPRVVYSTDDQAVRVWNIVSGASSRVRRGYPGNGGSHQVGELAIAGTRVAWMTLYVAGNSQETWARLKTASVTGAGKRLVASAFRTDGYTDDGVEMWDGNWLTGLVGSGKLLAVSRWTTTHNVVSNPRLSVIDPKTRRLRTIASGEGSVVSAASDAGRIAALRSDGTVGVYSSAGRLLLQVHPSSAKELAFGGGRLVVLTQTRTLEVYDSGNGALLHTWPVHTSRARQEAGHLRAYGRIGVYSVDWRVTLQRLHIVDLATGTEHVLAAAQRPWASDAAVGPLGLVYGVNTNRFGAHPKHTGTLVFLPTARVLAMLGAGS